MPADVAVPADPPVGTAEGTAAAPALPATEPAVHRASRIAGPAAPTPPPRGLGRPNPAPPLTVARHAAPPPLTPSPSEHVTAPPPRGLGRPVHRSPATQPITGPPPAGPVFGEPDDPGEVAVSAGIARRESDGSVLFDPPPSDPAPAPDQPVDLAAMADELYDRIERRLRTNLLLERERRGILADR
jgi:hypothetical protein